MVVQWVGMVFIAMTLLIFVSNAVAIQYASGAVRTAVDEAARLGARLDGTTAECVDHAEEVLRGQGGLLRGTMGDSITFSCSIDGAVMVASATGEFEWWFGGVPTIAVDIQGRSVIEPVVEAAP
jgi:hypothetical protein